MPRSDLAEIVERLSADAAAGVEIVDEATGKALLSAWGVETPPGRVVESADAAVAFAGELGGPVGVKAVVSGLAHKSDVGGVVGPLASDAAVSAAAVDLLSRFDGSVLVERWVAEGTPCFVGLSFEGDFGPTVSFGLGGVWVEVLRDVAHRLAPLTPAEARAAVATLRGHAVLTGGRGGPALDVDALADTVARLSRLVREPALRGLVREIDVNPLLVRSEGPPVALDCTIVLAAGVPDGAIEPAIPEVAR